jgi:hypothetical protein
MLAEVVLTKAFFCGQLISTDGMAACGVCISATVFLGAACPEN